jgi:secreted trypsin-like serine protease
VLKSVLRDIVYFIQTKIVGGFETYVNEFPEMAGIVNLASSSVFCGATISKCSIVMNIKH